jgi:diguanylate cyclase (GGDEF)-like protein/PAS domain S-box-containing protein
LNAFDPSPPDSGRSADELDAIIRATFEVAPDGLVVVDHDGRLLALNHQFAHMWPLPDAVVQRREMGEIRDLIARQLKAPQTYLDKLPTAALAGLGTALHEFEHVDGRIFERQVSPLGAAGFPGVVIARWRDITARRRAELALRQVQLRLAAMFEHALDAILLADDQGRCLDANPAACRLVGRRREDLLGSHVADLLLTPPDDFEPAWHEFLRHGTASGQVRLRGANGHAIVARYSSVANIQPGVHLSILSDITDEVRARQQQLETTAQLELAMSNADIVFWVVDLETGGVRSADPQWPQHSLGYAPDEVGPGLEAWDVLVHPDDAQRRKDAWHAHVAGRSPAYEAEFRLRHKDGHWLWLQVRGRAVARDASGVATRIVGTRIDITRRKLAEQMLEAQAYTDGLTGTLNRRRFLELAEVELSRTRRHGQPVALLMVDLDHFKSINDAHGHAGGDAVLRAFARTAGTVMRSSDLLGRVGGEEFAVLLPQTDLDGAAALAHRLQTLVREQAVTLGSGRVPYTVSVGVAAWAQSPATGDTMEALMHAADMALYRAKGDGRDRVLVADPPAPAD